MRRSWCICFGGFICRLCIGLVFLKCAEAPTAKRRFRPKPPGTYKESHDGGNTSSKDRCFSSKPSGGSEHKVRNWDNPNYSPWYLKDDVVNRLIQKTTTKSSDVWRSLIGKMSEYHVKVFGVKSPRRRNEISALMSSVSKHIDVIANINNKTFRIYNLFTRSNVQYILLQGGALDSRHLPKFRDVMNELDELIHDKKETMDIINMETFCSVKEQALNDFRRIDTLVEEDAREPPPPPTMFSPSMHNLGSKDKDVKEKERDHFMRQTDVKETPFSEPQKTYRPPRDLIKEKPATGIPDAPVSEPQKTYQPPRDLIKEKPASDIPNAPFYEYQKAYRPPQDAKEEKPATVIPNAPFYEYQKAYRPPQDVNEEKPATGITSGKQQQPSNGRSGVVSDESHFHSDSDGSLYTSYMERKNRSKLHSSQMSLIPLCFMANVIIYMILYG